MLRLNLGCCDELLAGGWTNVDIFKPPDVSGFCFEQADLSRPWPWPDGSVALLRAWDIIEHLPDKIHTMNEAWRVLRPGGCFEIVVPTTDGRGAGQDPQHVSYWNRNSFFYYTHGNPHRERFGAAYGIEARFKVVSEKFERLQDEVTKLTILLECVK